MTLTLIEVPDVMEGMRILGYSLRCPKLIEVREGDRVVFKGERSSVPLVMKQKLIEIGVWK